MNNLYRTKGSFEIKDIDAGKREVAVYLAKFDLIDSDADIIKKGAFAKSISDRGPSSPSNRKIAFLRYHDWEKQIGKFISIEEDSLGLFAVGQLGTSTIGEDALRDYEEGIIREHSIGFQYIPDKMKWVEDFSMPTKGFYEVSEVKLFEGSAVTFGANEYTNTVDVMKSLNKATYLDKLAIEINAVTKALSNGKGSDERLQDLSMKIKYLTSQVMLLATQEPSNEILSNDVQPTNEGLIDWSNVLTRIQEKYKI
jgi:HK97 family phage prohead protease